MVTSAKYGGLYAGFLRWPLRPFRVGNAAFCLFFITLQTFFSKVLLFRAELDILLIDSLVGVFDAGSLDVRSQPNCFLFILSLFILYATSYTNCDYPLSLMLIENHKLRFCHLLFH